MSRTPGKSSAYPTLATAVLHDGDANQRIAGATSASLKGLIRDRRCRFSVPSFLSDLPLEETLERWSSTPTLITSERGKEKLCYEGHSYVFDKLSVDKMLHFWRCHLRRECKVRLHRTVAEGEVVFVSGTHSDPPDPANVEVAIRKSSLKRRATETQDSPAQLINHA